MEYDLKKGMKIMHKSIKIKKNLNLYNYNLEIWYFDINGIITKNNKARIKQKLFYKIMLES